MRKLAPALGSASLPAGDAGHSHASLPNKVTTASKLVDAPERKQACALQSTAFLQYTSGSSSQPKGVIITHANLAHQCAMLGALARMDAGTRCISWLPLHHDMGLLAVLAPLHHGGHTVLLPPNAVLQRPLLRLETAARERATMLVGPDFAYAACAVAAEKHGLPTKLDLSALTAVWTGAEPVRPETLARFTQAFAPAGFNAESWLPCYGMAETTLMSTGRAPGRAPVVLSFDAAALAGGVARLSEVLGEDSSDALSRRRDTPVPSPSIEIQNARHKSLPSPCQPVARALTSCGVPHAGMEIAIVEPDTRVRLPEGRVGEIWVHGGSVAAGYFGKEELTREVFGAKILECGSLLPLSDAASLLAGDAGHFAAPLPNNVSTASELADFGERKQACALQNHWLRTGDLGFLHEGELYPCAQLRCHRRQRTGSAGALRFVA